MKRWLRKALVRLRLRGLWIRAQFIFTGDCGQACGVETFRKLDGTPFQQFVPEADCPVHDICPGEDRGVDVSGARTCGKEGELRGIIVLNGITRAQFEELRREIETALESQSLEDGLLILHEVPEVLYIPVGGANDQASS